MLRRCQHCHSREVGRTGIATCADCRRKRQAAIIRRKRCDPDYRRRENKANKARMRKRRGKRRTVYVALERAHGWWHG